LPSIFEQRLEQAKLISVCKPTDTDEFGVRRPTFRMIESVVAQGQSCVNSEMTCRGKISELILIAISGVAIDWSRREAAMIFWSAWMNL
jgi:hypothetical protein